MPKPDSEKMPTWAKVLLAVGSAGVIVFLVLHLLGGGFSRHGM